MATDVLGADFEEEEDEACGCCCVCTLGALAAILARGFGTLFLVRGTSVPKLMGALLPQ